MKLKKNKKIFEDIYATLAELNRVFSLPAFVFLSLRMISCAVGLYVTIYGCVSGNEYLQKITPALTAFCIVGFLDILTLFTAADQPKHQV